jgi:hypothetical protein
MRACVFICWYVRVAQELLLDHVFSKLGISGGHVAHPIVLTEPLGNANASRRRMHDTHRHTQRVNTLSECMRE